MTQGLTFRTKVHFRAGRNGRKYLEQGDAPPPPVEPGRVPRVARMMALAIRFDGLIRSGVVLDQADLARLEQRLAGPRVADHEPAALGPRHPGATPLPAAGPTRRGADPGARRSKNRRRARLAEAAAVVEGFRISAFCTGVIVDAIKLLSGLN